MRRVHEPPWPDIARSLTLVLPGCTRDVSYDLYLLKKNGDPAEAHARLEEQEEREPTPDEEAALRRLAADLQAVARGLTSASQGSASFCSSATRPSDQS